jgi:hypothetical protein
MSASRAYRHGRRRRPRWLRSTPLKYLIGQGLADRRSAIPVARGPAGGRAGGRGAGARIMPMDY